MGVTAESLVVAYDDSRFAYGARLWWLLQYLGHRGAAVLDGGWGGWLGAGYGVSDALPAPQPGRFRPRLQSQLLVTRDQVIAQLDALTQGKAELVLVDGRSPERYRGEVEPIDPLAGSIPGAANRFWQDVTDAAGFALPPAQQAQRWQDLAPASALWQYCGSGVTACVNLLSMALAGLDHGRLYGGGWSDWCAYLTTEATEATAAQEKEPDPGAEITPEARAAGE
jgi:thiosulfate/3-mercaptopyruvate sulfurtransferase